METPAAKNTLTPKRKRDITACNVTVRSMVATKLHTRIEASNVIGRRKINFPDEDKEETCYVSESSRRRGEEA